MDIWKRTCRWLATWRSVMFGEFISSRIGFGRASGSNDRQEIADISNILG